MLNFYGLRTADRMFAVSICDPEEYWEVLKSLDAGRIDPQSEKAVLINMRCGNKWPYAISIEAVPGLGYKYDGWDRPDYYTDECAYPVYSASDLRIIENTEPEDLSDLDFDLLFGYEAIGGDPDA